MNKFGLTQGWVCMQRRVGLAFVWLKKLYTVHEDDYLLLVDDDYLMSFEKYVVRKKTDAVFHNELVLQAPASSPLRPRTRGWWACYTGL
jgi:hypothetical protein